MSKPPTYTALSDIYGKIEEVLVSMPPGNDASIRQRYDGLMNALGGRVDIVLLGRYEPIPGEEWKQQAQELRSLERAVGRLHSFREHQLYIMEPDFEFGTRAAPLAEWVADPFTILKGPENCPVFLEPYYFGKNMRGQDQHIAEQVSAHRGYLIKSTKYEFEGGNILVGDDFMLVGRDTLKVNMQRYHPEIADLDMAYDHTVISMTAAFEAAFGMRYVIWLGEVTPFELAAVGGQQGEKLSQVFFHIDLYVTLGGKTDAGEELVFVAELEAEDLQRLPEGPLRDGWRAVNAALDRVQDQLESHHTRAAGPKFKVARIPLGIRKRGDRYYPLSLNNALVEIYSGVKAMYLPKYDARGLGMKDVTYLQNLQVRTEAAIRAHQFHPIWVTGDFYDNAPTYSSLHCLVKVLRRSNRAY